MGTDKPPFERALLVGVVGVATMLPWYERFGSANAWTTTLTVLGTGFPVWLVLPLAAFSVAITWGAYRGWHDLPPVMPVLLDGGAVLLSGAAIAAGHPGIGAVVGFVAAAVIGVLDVVALRRLGRRGAWPEPKRDGKVARMRRKRRFLAGLRKSQVHAADARPEPTRAELDG